MLYGKPSLLHWYKTNLIAAVFSSVTMLPKLNIYLNVDVNCGLVVIDLHSLIEFYVLANQPSLP